MLVGVNVDNNTLQGLGPGVHSGQSVRHVGQLRLRGAALEYEDWGTEERISGSSEGLDLPRLQRSQWSSTFSQQFRVEFYIC